MNELCDCTAHDSFGTSYIGLDHHLHCVLCKRILPGWDAITVGSIDDEPELKEASA